MPNTFTDINVKNILFVPSGIGLGHATRTHAIINETKKHAKFKVAAYGSAYNYFEKQGLEPLQLRGFNFHGEYSFELMKTLVKEADMFFKLAGDYLKISKLNKTENFNTIVSDSDPIGIISAYFMKKQGVLVENFQDVLRESKYIPKRFQDLLGYQLSFIEQVDRYVSKITDMTLEISFEGQSFKSSKKKSIGLIRKNEVDEKALKEAGKIDFICVPIPGSTLTYDIIRGMVSVFKEFPNENFFLINFPTNTVKKLKNVYLFPFMSNPELQAYIKQSKAVITFAGLSTLTDIAYHQKPSLILPLPNHIEQISNATYFRRNKLGEVVYPRRGYDSELIQKMLQKLLSNKASYEENLAKAKFKFNGAQIAADLIVKE